MCTNFSSTQHRDWFELKLKRVLPSSYPLEAYPGYDAPLLKAHQGRIEEQVSLARFGLIPSWSKDEKIARFTYNARCETIEEKPSFKGAYSQRRFGVVLIDDFFEPCYEGSKVIRYRIKTKNSEPFGVACLWETWRNKSLGSDAQSIDSFTMITLNADAHAVMNKMHAPGDEKRTPLVLSVDQFDAWLTASHVQAREFMKGLQMPELVSEPAPLVRSNSKKSQTVSARQEQTEPKSTASKGLAQGQENQNHQEPSKALLNPTPSQGSLF